MGDIKRAEDDGGLQQSKAKEGDRNTWTDRKAERDARGMTDN